MKRFFAILLTIIIILAVSLKDEIIELAIEKTCRFVTGVKLDIEKMEVGILRTNVYIKGLKLYNPDTYEERIMADIPEIYVDYNPGKIVRGTISLNEMRFYLKELNIIRNRDAEVNIDSLKAVKNKSDGEEMARKERGKVPDIEIKLLHLKAEDVFYKDYSKEIPVVQKIKVNIDKKYENITNLYTLIRLIISSVIKDTVVSNIVNMPMTRVRDIMKNTYQTGTTAINNTVQATRDAAEKILEKPSETITGAAKELGEVLGGGIFQKKKNSE